MKVLSIIKPSHLKRAESYWKIRVFDQLYALRAINQYIKANNILIEKQII